MQRPLRPSSFETVDDLCNLPFDSCLIRTLPASVAFPVNSFGRGSWRLNLKPIIFRGEALSLEPRVLELSSLDVSLEKASIQASPGRGGSPGEI